MATELPTSVDSRLLSALDRRYIDIQP